MIQVLALVAVIFTLALAALTSASLAARAALDRFAAHATDAALRDALARYTSDVRAIVAAQGASGPWPASPQTDPFPHDTSLPQPLCSDESLTKACPFSYTSSWTIDGHTNAAAGGTAAGPDTANNLQRAVIDEERIAGSVSVRLTDRRGNVVAERTRFVTARVFDAAPYAIVSGMRETTTVNGWFAAAQGDSAGTPARSDGAGLADAAAPDPSNPDRYRDTRINVEMDCVEESSPFDESDPFADNAAVGDDGLPWGVSGRAFEVPCNPTYANQIMQNAPSGRPYPSNPYPVNDFAQSSWTTGDASDGSWSP